MKKTSLKELNFASREEALVFLKKLWSGEGAACPICGSELEPLHGKAKKSDCEWQCRKCDRVFRTVNILYELNG